jgi:hypothetical protein
MAPRVGTLKRAEPFFRALLLSQHPACSQVVFVMKNSWKAVWQQRQLWLPSVVMLAIFYTLIASYALRLNVLRDPDVWWHLRTGQWIVEHRALPVTDPFSQAGAGKAWIAYSWLFEVLLYGGYARFGLAAIFGLTVLLWLAIVLALVLLVRPYCRNDKQALLYCLLGVAALLPLCNPRPWLFTILFFLIEYAVLLAVRRGGSARWLWLLPPLFALWANIHIQFIYGYFLLCFDTVEPLLARWWRREWSWAAIKQEIPWQRWCLLAACVLATLATPFHFGLYRVVREYAEQADVYQFVGELKPISFDNLTPWAGLALLLWVIFRLGWRRIAAPGPLGLLLVGVFLAFRSNRDIWFLVIAAVGALGVSSNAGVATLDNTAAFVRPVWLTHTLALALAVPLLVWRATRADMAAPVLQAQLEKHYPVAAAQVIEARGYQGPLFNHFDWGGYLIWRLPQLPVSIDGRTNIYGGAWLARQSSLWSGGRNWAHDQELNAAGIVVANINYPLCELLRRDQRFALVYEDHLAAIFLARERVHALATASEAANPLRKHN